MMSLILSGLLQSGCDKEPEPKTADAQAAFDKTMVHQGTGVVRESDPAKEMVVISHEAVKSLNWPAMTMRFAVKDKSLFDKLAVSKKVDFEFMQTGTADFILTAVK
jgi:Cu(I)/Ag(I) efflux system protein CusF